MTETLQPGGQERKDRNNEQAEDRDRWRRPAAVIAGGALTGAALRSADSGQIEGAAVSESPATTIERADVPAGGDDSTPVEAAALGS